MRCTGGETRRRAPRGVPGVSSPLEYFLSGRTHACCLTLCAYLSLSRALLRPMLVQQRRCCPHPLALDRTQTHGLSCEPAASGHDRAKCQRVLRQARVLTPAMRHLRRCCACACLGAAGSAACSARLLDLGSKSGARRRSRVADDDASPAPLLHHLQVPGERALPEMHIYPYMQG